MTKQLVGIQGIPMAMAARELGGHLRHQQDYQERERKKISCRIQQRPHWHPTGTHWHGKADVVEFHQEDDGGWRPYPVEHKRGRPKMEDWDRVQLCAQAICLEEMLDCDIPAGALFYGKTRRRQEVFFDEKLRREVAEAAARLHQLIAGGVTPPARYEKKCDNCSLLNLCMPKVAGAGKSVGRYLARMLTESG